MSDKTDEVLTNSKHDKPRSIPWYKVVLDQGVVTPEILTWKYEGSGTEEDHYVVHWIDDDPRDPMRLPQWKKWWLTMTLSISTLAVAFVSSAYTGDISKIILQFKVSTIVAMLGVSLYVLGFAVGPLLWAPLSETYGRQVMFVTTFGGLTAFNAGCAGAQNMATLIVLRFFAGTIGSSPLTNAGGVIADLFGADQRGLAGTFFAAAPFLGPVIGPIVGGFVGETVGWRWVQGVMAIFTGTLWIIGSLLVPETYAPVLLRRRAARLSKITGKVYRSRGDILQGSKSLLETFKVALSRPWMLLFRELIVALLSIYLAIVYGTLYLMFGAFPIVFQQKRHWSPGIGGLAFLGIAVGMLFAILYAVYANQQYKRISKAHNGFAPPEARLPMSMVGGIALPIGLFWFAWTNAPSVHWIVSIIGSAPFGFGMILVFLGVMNYLIDAYTIYAASVLAANSVLRSLFGMAFPLFTPEMYTNLGIHWASSIPAFLALACVPMPFLFYKYGPTIREHCKFAAESAAFMKKVQGQTAGTNSPKDVEEGGSEDKQVQ